MRSSRIKCAPVLLAALFLFSVNTILAGDDWRPITPEELAMKTPKVEPDADAEAIFWEVRVDDGSSTDLILKHYVRVKIFNERGREKWAKVDIPYDRNEKISNIMARVVKADGTIVPIAKSDVLEREILKTGDIKIKAKSFALQSVEPGAIVEYQYKQTFESDSANNMRMIFQRDIPVEKSSYYFKPALDAKYLVFNMGDTKFIQDKGGFYRATLENVPALREEPYMPPEDEVRSWLLLYYTGNVKSTYNDFWANYGYDVAQAYKIKDLLKSDKEMNGYAMQVAGGASAPMDKIRKVYDFCRTIRNITFDTAMTDEEKAKINFNKNPADTFKKMQGRQNEINLLFATLVSELGIETRLAFGGDRSRNFFQPRRAHSSFIHFAGVALKVNGEWRYFDPGDKFAEFGMLAWTEEGTSVLLVGSKDYITTETPLSDYDKSVAKRRADLTLGEDGSLEGLIRIEYSGHLGYVYKRNNYEDSPNKQEEALKEWVKQRIPGAEVSDVTIENAAVPEKPFTYVFKIRVPNYAQKAGKRMFMQPSFFTYGVNPMFAAADRKFDIFFRYPWLEDDEVKIKLPANYAIDNGEVPPGGRDPEGISELKMTMSVTAENTLVLKRRFHFGGGGYVLFPAGAYSSIKRMFDSFQKSDQSSLALKQK